MNVPTTNAITSNAANATAARSFPRHGRSSGGMYGGAVLMFSVCAEVGCDWSQLQNGQERACASIARSHRIHGFRSLITVETLQPAYRVVPDVKRRRAERKPFRPYVFRDV